MALSSGGKWTNALVFVHATDRTDYQTAFNFLSPMPDEGPVFALDAGAARRSKVLSRYPDRPVLIIGRPPDKARDGARIPPPRFRRSVQLPRDLCR